jgi:hypothetical protein
VPRKALLVAVLVLATGGAFAAFALGGGGAPASERGGAPSSFAWQGTPLEIEPEAGLEDDHIVSGVLRNTGLRAAELQASALQVVDADGRPLRTAARFLHNFAHGIYSPEMIKRDGPPPDAERRRLGEIAAVRPGESVPVTVSWRGAGATALDVGGATVRLP